MTSLEDRRFEDVVRVASVLPYGDNVVVQCVDRLEYVAVFVKESMDTVEFSSWDGESILLIFVIAPEASIHGITIKIVPEQVLIPDVERVHRRVPNSVIP